MALPVDPALADALRRVGDRWTLQVVSALLGGPLRFSDLAEAVAGIAPNILTARLRALEADGLVVARAYSQRPRRLEYELTADGEALAGALRLLTAWGARHLRDDAAPAPAACPACGAPLDEADDSAPVVV